MYQQGALAYQQAAKVVESPREREAALLVKAAANIQHIRDQWPVDQSSLRNALTFNRKIWTIFMNAVTREEHGLPAQVRQNIANLGLFVLNETREILVEPQTDRPVPNKLGTLVGINRQLAAGLRSMPQ